ncbi:hypothetical protein GF367_02965 [Candidatus Woesearchaeota archaeon]|nr:hypothetical protein [Candidatus Woesearchaeota archaeon]
MLNLPIEDIIQKITEATDKSADDVKQQIKQKLDELSGLISEAGAAHIVANELGVKLMEPQGPITVDKVLQGMRNIDIVGKARQVYEVREFNTEKRSGKVGNFLLTDKTGTTRVVLWNDHTECMEGLEPGDVVKITGAYARENNGRVEVHLGRESKLYRNPEGVTVDVDIDATPAQTATKKKIVELTEQDQNVTVTATIVQVFNPRFFAVCPKCNARIGEDSTCATHGNIEPTYNYVMNLYLDDSSDNIRCVLWREQIERLLGKDREAVLAFKEAPAAFEEYKTDLLGRIVKVRGRVKQNEAFGRLELVAYDIDKEVDPEKEVAELRHQEKKQRSEVVEKETVNATVDDDDKAESVTAKQETTLKDKSSPEEEVFTLDDVEDLEELD